MAIWSLSLAAPAVAQTADDFNPDADGVVYAVAIQPDGRVLVGGNFTTLGGQARSRIGRLNPDGTLDTAFNPGASGPVYCLALQPNGKILVGGDCLAQRNSDGTLDTTFRQLSGGTVYCLAVQADGKILVGGHFLSRLNPGWDA